jgi:hypothetical protein
MMRYTAIALTLVLSLLCATDIRGLDPQTKPDGYQQITSTHKRFEYVLPAGWTKHGFNAYKSQDGLVFEEVYPPAVITVEYCGSAVRSSGIVEAKVYDHGHTRGCYIARRGVNTQTNRGFRHTTFMFPTPGGVESLTIALAEEGFDQAIVKVIIDSIRVK